METTSGLWVFNSQRVSPLDLQFLPPSWFWLKESCSGPAFRFQQWDTVQLLHALLSSLQFFNNIFWALLPYARPWEYSGEQPESLPSWSSFLAGERHMKYSFSYTRVITEGKYSLGENRKAGFHPTKSFNSGFDERVIWRHIKSKHELVGGRSGEIPGSESNTCKVWAVWCLASCFPSLDFESLML